MRAYFFCSLLVMAVFLAGGCAQKVVRVKPPAEKKPEHSAQVAPMPPAKEAQATGDIKASPAASVAADAVSVFTPPQPEVRIVTVEKILLPDSDSVRQRLAVHEEKFARWDSFDQQFIALDLDDPPVGWQECFILLKKACDGYGWLQQEILETEAVAGRELDQRQDIWDIYQSDIRFMENGCESTFDAGVTIAADWLERYRQAVVEQSTLLPQSEADREKYDELLETERNLTKAFAGWAVSPENKELYSLALLRDGQIQAAAKILHDSLDSEKWDAKSVARRRHLADLLLTAKQYEEAKKQYKELENYFNSLKTDDQWVASQLTYLATIDAEAEDFVLYQAVLRAYLTFDGRRIPDGMHNSLTQLVSRYPESPLAKEAGHLFLQVEEQSRTWIEGQLLLANNLVEGKEYSQAVTIFDDLLAHELSDELRTVIQMSKDAALADTVLDQEMQQQEAAEKMATQWDEAARLFDSQRYDDAITAYRALLQTSFDAESKNMIKKATSAAAAEMRQKAAALAMKARKSDKLEDQKAYLLESWQLLMQILKKYPEVDIIDKVTQNLKTLEEQINLVDPELIEKAALDGQAKNNEPSPDDGPIPSNDPSPVGSFEK